MDKFSLYDFLSFFLPGVLFCFMVYQIVPESAHVFKSMGETIDGLIFLSIALIAGLSIHRLTFYLLKFKFYRKLIYPSVDEIVHSDRYGISVAVEKIENRHKLKIDELFDEAYFFLECNDKITTAKNFQSYYFFLRNLFTTSIISSPFYFVYAYLNTQTLGLFLAFLALLVLGNFLITIIAIFYRAKMVERVFNTYSKKDFVEKK